MRASSVLGDDDDGDDVCTGMNGAEMAYRAVT